ncbi:hypothetical protein SASPL_138585 [Salvia splendens]|uniref:ABC transporter domain-containing protein n=1 Tax=Salvia splendens TaxID=180675 RepID=A0A8X8WVG2_SALSN|nr:hypothetical protein SASPL_138585 [Salvia splendens]
MTEDLADMEVAHVPPRNPPEMDRLKLFDSNDISSDDDLSKIEINQEHAKNKKQLIKAGPELSNEDDEKIGEEEETWLEDKEETWLEDKEESGCIGKGIKPGLGTYSSSLDGACRYNNGEVIENVLSSMAQTGLILKGHASNYDLINKKLCGVGETFAMDLSLMRACIDNAELEHATYEYSFPNGASRRQQPVDRRNFGNSHQSQLEDGEFEVRQPEELHLDDSVSGKLDRLLDRLDKFEVWRADTDRRFQSLEPVISRDAEPPSVFEDGDDWGDKGFRRTRYGDRGNNFRNPSGGFRDSQQAGRGSRGGRGRPGSCWDPPWTRTCWDPPAYRETPRQHPFNEDHGGRHSTTWDSPWGRGDSGRQSPLLSTATTVASQPLLGFNGRSSRATHQPLSSEALWWDRYGSGGEGVRGRRPTAWDNPPQRVDDHTGRLAPTWETARGRHEDDRYSDPPRRIDASERRAAIAQPPAPAVASIPRLGFGDDSSIHGPQQATQPGASSGARYTVKGDGDRGKQPSASVAIEAPSSSTTDLLLQAKDLSVVIAESKQPILKEVNLTVRHGEVHAVMGKNDSGKSTFAKALAGHPDYEVTGGSVMYKGFDLREMESEERATVGLFMSFQSSVEIPGVSNIDFLNMAYNARRRELGLPELGPIEFYGYVAPKLELINMKTDFLNRYGRNRMSYLPHPNPADDVEIDISQI